MHHTGAGKTQQLAGQAFEAHPQGEMLALDLLHRQFPHRVLCWWEMPLIDTRLVCVIVRDAKGSEQGAEFQKKRILPSTHDVGEYSPRVMVDRMPQPPRPLFGIDETSHFIQLGGASGRDADGA